MRRLWYLMWKELLELRQDPRLFGVIFIAPIVQLTLLGYAATTDVKNVPIVVVDQDHTPQSRELITRFDGIAVLHGRRTAQQRGGDRDTGSKAIARGWGW